MDKKSPLGPHSFCLLCRNKLSPRKHFTPKPLYGSLKLSDTVAYLPNCSSEAWVRSKTRLSKTLAGCLDPTSMDSEKTDGRAVMETENHWLWALISNWCIYNTPTTPKAQKSGRKGGKSRRTRISAVRWCLLQERRKLHPWVTPARSKISHATLDL